MKNIFYAIYDSQDMIVTTCENYKEIAQFFGRADSTSIRGAVHNNTRILSNHNWYTIYKIDVRKK